MKDLKHPLIALRRLRNAFVVAVLAGVASTAGAAGIQPETSVVLVREADGEGTMTVRNLSNEPMLLLSTVEHIPEDKDDWVMVTPPAAVVAPGQTQLVRFLLSSGEPLKAQRLKRAIFEGIPQNSDKSNSVRFTLRQDLPLIALPKGETQDRAPWQKLAWSLHDGKLVVENASPYVVRMAQQLRLLPGDLTAELPKSYLLPGEKIAVRVSGGNLNAIAQVRMFPATVYGYQVEHFDAVVKK